MLHLLCEWARRVQGLLRLLTAVFCTILVMSAHADDKQDVLQAVERMGQAMVEGDWNTAFSYIDTATVSKGLPEVQAQQKLNKLKLNMMTSGIKIIELNPTGEPAAILDLDAYQFTYFPTEMKMQIGQQRFISTGSLLAFKYKDADDWKFLDASKLSAKQLGQYYPDIPEDIDLPPADLRAVDEFPETSPSPTPTQPADP